MVDVEGLAVLGAIGVILLLTVGRVVESAAGVVGSAVPSGPVLPDVGQVASGAGQAATNAGRDVTETVTSPPNQRETFATNEQLRTGGKTFADPKRPAAHLPNTETGGVVVQRNQDFQEAVRSAKRTSVVRRVPGGGIQLTGD